MTDQNIDAMADRFNTPEATIHADECPRSPNFLDGEAGSGPCICGEILKRLRDEDDAWDDPS